VKSLRCADHFRIEDERERLVTASPVMAKSRAPARGSNYSESGFVKPPRRDTRALGPAGLFGGKAPHRLAAQKSRLHAPSVPMRSAPAYFLCEWGVYTRLDLKHVEVTLPWRHNKRGGEDDSEKKLRPEYESSRSYYGISTFWSFSYVTILLRYGGLGMDSHLKLAL
jgi:hypothetical protein